MALGGERAYHIRKVRWNVSDEWELTDAELSGPWDDARAEALMRGIAARQNSAGGNDAEAHADADRLLTHILWWMGYEKTVAAYNSLPKYYA